MAEDEKFQITALSSAASNTAIIARSVLTPTEDTVVTLFQPAPEKKGASKKTVTTKKVEVTS